MISGKRKVAYLGFGISLAVIVALFVAGLIKTATYNRQVHYAAYQGQELSREKIIDEIERNKGLQFDPAIADIMLRLIESGEIKTGD